MTTLPRSPGSILPNDRDLTEVERWALNGLKAARDAVYDTRTGRATGVGTALPVVAPALDAVADFRKGDYAGAGLNVILAAGDVSPWGSAIKIFKLGNRVGWKNLARTDLTFDQAKTLLRKGDYIKKGQEVHHTVPIKGAHKAHDWRHNPLLLKPMPKPDHRRLTGKWGEEQRHNLPGKIWYGSNHWQKSVPLGVATYTVDAVENRTK